MALTTTSQLSRPVNGVDYHETLPLISENDVLARAIYERCVDPIAIEGAATCCHRVALGVSMVASLGANASFIPISLRLPGGPFFAAANFIGFFKLDIWAIRGTINDLFGIKGPQEAVLMKRASLNKCYAVVIATSSLVIALLSQVPVALPALDYNGDLKIPSVIFLFAGGTLIPIRSLQLSINKSLRMQSCRLREVDKKIKQLRALMSSSIEQHLKIFRKMEHSAKLDHIRRLKQLNQESELEKTYHYILIVFETPFITSETKGASLLGRISTIAGGWLTLSLEAGLAIYTYEKTKENVIDSDFAASLLALSVVASSFYLTGNSIINTTKRLAGSLLNMISCQKEQTIAEIFRPRLVLSFKLLGLVIDLGALGATLVIWGDFFKENLPAKIYFDITLCLAYFLFLSTATLDMVDEAVTEVINRKGSVPEKQIIELQQGLLSLKKLFEDSSLIDFSFFVTKTPLSLKQKLLTQVNLTIEQLNEHMGVATF